MSDYTLNKQKLQKLFQIALEEDCPAGDVTAQCLLKKNTLHEATIISKDTGIFCGELIFSSLIALVSPLIEYQIHVKDGEPLTPNQYIATLKGPAFSLLILERPLLNFLQRLCGISTLTHRYVTTLNNPKIDILDTRKTSPGLRDLEKYAVKIGGGKNHRMSLSDMVLIKENHLDALKKEGAIAELHTRIQSFKLAAPHIPIEIEIETLDQLEAFDLKAVDFILLDNFDISDIEKAIVQCKAKGYTAKLEISGNISLETLPLYRHLDIHRISIGKLTHSAPAFDLSLRMAPLTSSC